MVVAALRLDGLDDQSHAGVPNLLLPLQSLLNQRQTPLVLSLVLSRVLFQRVPLKELSSTVGPNNTVYPSWGYVWTWLLKALVHCVNIISYPGYAMAVFGRLFFDCPPG